MDVTSALLDDFKQLVEERGISGDTIILKQNNGTEQEDGHTAEGSSGASLLIVLRSHRR